MRSLDLLHSLLVDGRCAAAFLRDSQATGKFALVRNLMVSITDNRWPKLLSALCRELVNLERLICRVTCRE